MRDSRRALSDEPLQRPGKMSLVVITRFVNHIEDRGALLQEMGRPPGALNLVNGPASQPRYLENASLFGSRRDILQLSTNRALHGAIAPINPLRTSWSTNVSMFS